MVRLALDTLLRSSAARHQFLRYLVVGTGVTAVSYAAYALGLAAGLSFRLASLVALLIGVAAGFVAHGRVSFMARLQGRFWRFAASCATLYFANITLIELLNWSGLDIYIAGLVAAALMAPAAFLLQRHLVFADPPMPTLQALALGTLVLLAAARLQLLLQFEINWDEFLNLAMVHSHAHGELREMLQTAFVHLFAWVPAVSANEVDQVIAARLLVFAFVTATSAAIYGTARRFMGVTEALVAVIAFNGFNFVMRNGGALRTDSLATCVMMIAIWIATAHRFGIRQALALGACAGVAGVLTIKSVFYVGVIAAILLVRIVYDQNRRRALGLAALSAAIAMVTCAVIIALHAATFPDQASAFTFVARTAGATILTGDYLNFMGSVRTALAGNPAFWLLLIVGFLAAVARIRHAATRREGVIQVSLALLLFTPLIYSEVFPYYYPFMLAPASVLIGIGFERIAHYRNGLFAGIFLAFLAVGAAMTYLNSLQQGLDDQRRMLALVHSLFPRPVPYIDHTSMVSSYPKQGIFMSGWGMTDYRRKGVPIMETIIATKSPRFVLATRWSLDLANLEPEQSEASRYGLLAADVRALQDNYLPYWGQLYLPGFRVRGTSARMVSIAGRYRVKADQDVEIDGLTVAPGRMVVLNQGPHRFVTSTTATFLWDAPAPPTFDPPVTLFYGF
ncbi:MAG TPA: GtrA family protein [Povalibacter sp.]|nr:GtrA family protein [Povalibacter sp.]